MAFAVLFGAMCAAPAAADAATSRNTRETVKQPRAALHQPVAVRSAKSPTLKPLPPELQRAENISCVPYARAVSGIEITGNAHTWWAGAAGAYARGQRPERGSVLSFRASGGMRLGHVAVVSRVVGPREVLIDHANWEGPGIRKGTVMRGVSVIDVSDRNDWTAVRVQTGRSDDAYGRVYATNGFIHNRAPGTMMAKGDAVFEEVAEAPPARSAHAEHIAGAVRELNVNAVRR
ncbi:amidase [Pseudoroseomonas rhizosphaerae]|uniref:Amidase n=1 Tax=Teichococcus rhizosphaerae TaxID=1335062 RepID=A0A2C7AHJ5_9PROT|nr:CHAP domain-containing protein [Pseudoroseomonas rhizosphaerae]PHK96696.1 amidase [Pseudoroseomonas rhizosphaerae]